MQAIKTCAYMLTFLVLQSCSVNNAISYFKEGEIAQQDYKETIPFQLKDGYIITQVIIQNETYNFLVDTGAPNVISKELADHLNLVPLDSIEVGDVFKNSKTKKYARIPSIKMGAVEFLGTVAVVNDFNSVKVWSELNIDGFIGSSLMQHAVWDINFKQKQITITDEESKLSLPDHYIETKLFVGYGGVPSIACKINGKKVWNFTVDLGFNGGIVIPYKTFDWQQNKGMITDFKASNGEGIIGIYGKQETESASYRGIINSITLGDEVIENQNVYAQENFSHMFGSKFLRNYRIILNYKGKKIKLIAQAE